MDDVLEGGADMMDPGSLDELLGAYALDALDADERRAVDEYLLVSPQARAEVREHQEVATFLAFSGASAPDGLWDRISGSLDGVAPSPGPELAKVMPIDRRRRMAGRVASWALASAAAAVIAVVAVQVIDGRSEVRDPIAEAVDQARADRDSRVAMLTAEGSDVSVEAIVDQDGHGYLIASELPALSSDQTYQLWGVVNDTVISLGILGRSPEIESFSVEGDLTALVITEEVAGGVAVSEQPALLVAEI